MGNLTDLIREKKAAMAQLQAELDEALAELTSELASPKAVGPHRTGKRGKSHAPAPRGNGGPPEILADSSTGRAASVIRQAGKPLHVKEIIRRIEADGHKVLKTTLVGNLSRYNKEKRVFYRPRPSVYGLLEMKK